MAILTSSPGAENEVNVYDVPDDVLAQYAMTGDKAAAMFPEGATAGIPKASAEMSPTKVDNTESLGEVRPILAFASAANCSAIRGAAGGITTTATAKNSVCWLRLSLRQSSQQINLKLRAGAIALARFFDH